MDSVEGALWLADQIWISFPILGKKKASRFASVTSKEITPINDEAVSENKKKATKFGLAVFKGNGLSF